LKAKQSVFKRKAERVKRTAERVKSKAERVKRNAERVKRKAERAKSKAERITHSMPLAANLKACHHISAFDGEKNAISSGDGVEIGDCLFHQFGKGGNVAAALPVPQQTRLLKANDVKCTNSECAEVQWVVRCHGNAAMQRCRRTLGRAMLRCSGVAIMQWCWW
jgi:hypothetical protein